MSLINEMLKDLEKRRNPPKKEDYFSNLRGTSTFSSPVFHKNSIFIFTLLTFSLLIFFVIAQLYSSDKILSAREPDTKSSLNLTDKTNKPDAPIANFLDMRILPQNETSQIEFNFTQPLWYEVQHNLDENKVLLTLNNLNLSPACGTLTLAACLDKLFLKNENDFSLEAKPFPNEKNQFQLVFSLHDEINLIALNYDELKGKLTVTLGHDTPATPDDPQQMSIKKNSHNMISLQDQYRAAWRLLDVEPNQGITKLEVILAENPSFKEARLGLISVFLQLKRFGDANQLIQEGKRLHLHDDTFIMMEARLQLAQNNPASAQKTLLSISPPFKSHLDYYALLAATFEKNQEYAQSAALYEKLLALRPTEAIWWLGLGVSQEALGDKNAALESYEHTFDSSELPPSLQSYVSTRIRELGGNPLA
ncbi:MAG: hypothetical protein HY939_04015 [Gammaproteobacteria bacterium]|nr:hypothetical protein [Gammaproteobacteria bacterium]